MKSFDPYALVVAVNHLTDVVGKASEINLFKDYFMPIFVVMLSAVTAYFIAIRGYQYQESYKNEKAKADTLNQIILKMQGMQAHLIGVKRNYYQNLNTNPISRAMNFPPVPIQIECETLYLNELTQLLYFKERNVDLHPWFNIASFVATIGNYNQFIELMKVRNELEIDLRPRLEPLISENTTNGIKVTAIQEALGPMLTMKYIDLTEKLIIRIDDLLITIDDFLCNFSEMASESLNKKYLKNYVYLHGSQTDSGSFKEIFKRCKEVDIFEMAVIMQLAYDDAVDMYQKQSVVITTPKI